MDKVTPIGVVLLILGIALGAFVCYITQVSSLQGQVESLRSQVSSQQTQMASLSSNNTALQDRVEALEDDKAELQSQITSLQSDIQDKDRRINELENAYVNGLAGPSASSSQYGPYYTFKGHISNYGTKNAYNVYAILSLYYQDQKVHEEKVFVGDLAGREMDSFETSFTFYGTWDKWDWIETHEG